MGRLQKSKKHLGCKDPYSKEKQTREKLKNFINKRPKNIHVQEESKFFQMMSSMTSKRRCKDKSLNSEEQAKNLGLMNFGNTTSSTNKIRKGKDSDKGNSSKNNQNKIELLDTARFINKDVGSYPKNGRPFKSIPTVQQLPHENETKFMNRVKEVTRMTLEDSKFEEKYKVGIDRDEFGAVVGYNNKAPRSSSKIMKRLKYKERKLAKKQKKKMIPEINYEEKREEWCFRTEEFAYGDIVHRPPQLETKKLESMAASRKPAASRIQKKLVEKEEQMDTALRKQQLEKQREAAVLAYRQCKAQQRMAKKT